jgi:hypothetical protein
VSSRGVRERKRSIEGRKSGTALSSENRTISDRSLLGLANTFILSTSSSILISSNLLKWASPLEAVIRLAIMHRATIFATLAVLARTLVDGTAHYTATVTEIMIWIRLTEIGCASVIAVEGAVVALGEALGSGCGVGYSCIHLSGTHLSGVIGGSGSSGLIGDLVELGFLTLSGSHLSRAR